MTPLLRRRIAVEPRPDRSVRVYVALKGWAILLVASRLALFIGDCQPGELHHVGDGAGPKVLPVAGSAATRDAP